MLGMSKKLKVDDFDLDDELDVSSDDYRDLFKEKKKELLLEGRRARVTTMSFHDWFVSKYKRDYKQADKAISDAYHAGAADEVENNEYIIEHAEMKMDHYKNRATKLADDVQILYSLLEGVARKADMPEALRKLVKKTLNSLS